MRMTDLSI